MIRIAVPYTGMIISTRESQACREKLLHLGVQIYTISYLIEFIDIQKYLYFWENQE